MAKFYCTACGRDIDEVELSEYKEHLSMNDEDRFDDSGLCPKCFEMVK